MAFTINTKEVINKKNVDWTEMIRRNIDQKASNVFKALGWSADFSNQLLLL